MAAPMATEYCAQDGNTALPSPSFKVSWKRCCRPLKKNSGPPRNSTFPSMRRPWLRPVTVWSTTAWKMLAATSSLWAPWFNSGWMSVLAKTPQREAMG